MKLTHFFLLLFLFILSLLFLLSPEVTHVNNDKEIPMLEIEDFRLYEITPGGVDNIVSGTVGRQYATYYNVENAHYVENKNRMGEHLYADHGKFEDDMAYLEKNVRYFREDGLSFECDKARYDTKKEELYIPSDFTLTHNENIVYGNQLRYNVKEGKISASKVDASYYLLEK